MRPLKQIPSITAGIGMALLVSATHVAAEQPTPLSAQELAQCASDVQSLRTQAAELNEQATENDTTRQEIALLKQTASNTAETQLAYQNKALAFNKHMQQFQQDLIALDGVKRRFDKNCANRPYRVKDLEALPQDKQNAMQQGLDDVLIPELAPGN